MSAPSGDRPGPCGCAKLLRRDWGWPNDLEEEREVARLELRRALGGRPIPVETVPEDAPPSSDAFTHWELLATYKGSLSEKHLRAYLDEHAFRNNRRDEVVAERFLRVARALPDTPPRSYREIIVRPQPTGLALSIFDVGA